MFDRRESILKKLFNYEVLGIDPKIPHSKKYKTPTKVNGKDSFVIEAGSTKLICQYDSYSGGKCSTKGYTLGVVLDFHESDYFVDVIYIVTKVSNPELSKKIGRIYSNSFHGPSFRVHSSGGAIIGFLPVVDPKDFGL